MTEEKKNREGMHKDLDAMQKKAKSVEEALKRAKQALEAFQVNE